MESEVYPLRAFSGGLATLRAVIFLMWREATSYVKLRLLLVIGLTVAAAGLTPLGPYALKLLVDRFTGDRTAEASPILLLIGFYVLSQWLTRSMSEIKALIYARAERRIFRTLSERMFAHIMQLPLRFHLDRQTGGLNQTLDNGLQGCQAILNQLVFAILPVVAELTVVSFILVKLDHPVFVEIFGASVICYAIAFAYFALRIAGAAKAAASARVDASALMTDSILNYETVKFFAAESVVQQKVGQAFSQTEHDWVRLYHRYAASGLTVSTIFAGFLMISIVYSSHLVSQGALSIGTFILVNTYMLQIVSPIEVLGHAMQGLSQGVAMVAQMLVLQRERPEAAQTSDTALPEGGGRLEFERVSVAYHASQFVVRNVSFTVPAGATLGIVGASGAGKSTIVRLLVRLLEPDDGRILLDGASLSTLPLSTLRRCIAVVPQDTILFNETIAYNIAFGKAGSTPEEVERAARLAHLHEFIMSLPQQYDTPVGERGVKLSGGEKQRISIARAVIKRPRIYVFDEATSSLDSRIERQILQNLQEVSQSTTTVIIAHRLSTIVHADKIIVLENGSVAETGSHRDLLSLNGRYTALWHAQERKEVAA